MNITTVGIDLAKKVFSVHGVGCLWQGGCEKYPELR